MEKGPFTTLAERTNVKSPGRGQNDPSPLQCDSGKSRKFIEKTTHQHRFRDNSITFSETIHQQQIF